VDFARLGETGIDRRLVRHVHLAERTADIFCHGFAAFLVEV
jgi:hypothetical protein